MIAGVSTARQPLSIMPGFDLPFRALGSHDYQTLTIIPQAPLLRAKARETKNG
jgi:hypothetical protein